MSVSGAHRKDSGSSRQKGHCSATTLDPCPRVIAPGRAVIFTLECDEAKWKNYR